MLETGAILTKAKAAVFVLATLGMFASYRFTANVILIEKPSSVTATVDINKMNNSEVFKRFFQPAIVSKTDRLIIAATIKGCVELLKRAGFETALIFGSLLGWYRHGGMLIDWDDDVDFVLLPTPITNAKSAWHYKRLFSSMKTNATFSKHFGSFGVFVQDQAIVKCFPIDETLSRPIKGYDWRWPFVDFFIMELDMANEDSTLEKFDYFDQNLISPVQNRTQATTIRLSPNYTLLDLYKWPLDWFFPLQKSTFEGVDVNIPKEPVKLLTRQYANVRLCQAPNYDHRIEDYRESVTVDCLRLAQFVNLTNVL